MDFHPVVRGPCESIAKMLDGCEQKSSNWARRHVLSRVIYFIACEAMALLALAHHTYCMAVQLVPVTAKSIARALPLNRLNRLAKKIPRDVSWFNFLDTHFSSFVVSTTAIPLLAGLTFRAHRPESFRRLVKQLFYTEDDQKQIHRKIELLNIAVICLMAGTVISVVLGGRALRDQIVNSASYNATKECIHKARNGAGCLGQPYDSHLLAANDLRQRSWAHLKANGLKYYWMYQGYNVARIFIIILASSV